MRRFVMAVAGLVVGIALVAPAEMAAAAQGPGDATNYQVNATHTGLAPGAALPNTMRRLWFKDFGMETSYPLIVGNRVFVAGRPKKAASTPSGPVYVYAFDKRTGRQLWRSVGMGGDFSVATLAYGSGKLVVMNDGDRFDSRHAGLRGLNPGTGKTLWKKKLVAPPYTTIAHTADEPVTVRGGVAYLNFGYSGESYMAVDVVTGKTKWASYGIIDDTLGQSVSSNRVFYGSSCTWSARTLSGKQVWENDFGCAGGLSATTSVLSGSKLWLPANLHGSWVVDARNGKPLFTFDSDSVPTIVGGKAFLTPSDPSAVEGIRLQAVSSATGAEVWSRRPAGKYGSIIGPAIATSKVVYVTTSAGWVLGYSTATGKQVWTGHAGGTVDPQVDHLKNEGSAIGGGVLAVSATNRLAVFG